MAAGRELLNQPTKNDASILVLSISNTFIHLVLTLKKLRHRVIKSLVKGHPQENNW